MRRLCSTPRELHFAKSCSLICEVSLWRRASWPPGWEPSSGKGLGLGPCQCPSDPETSRFLLLIQLGLGCHQRSLHSLDWRKCAESQTPELRVCISVADYCQPWSSQPVCGDQEAPDGSRRCGRWPSRQLSAEDQGAEGSGAGWLQQPPLDGGEAGYSLGYWSP